jgi:hypothetical protein
MAAKPDTQQKLFGFRVLKAKYELLPLVGCLSFAAVIGTVYSIYALYQKSDVWINKKTTDIPPWEVVDPEKSAKFLTFNQKYQKIPELESLRAEIGSYRK